ncbi:sigma-54-dependent transcriptional regulator [Planctomicrobium sp. SH664]|uniref:sigma-54-dependent transcriptional regulator n=1 Tax=Planctomicrobium sp. SH664 TaxID=3448125 RepID=UPI003F5B898F
MKRRLLVIDDEPNIVFSIRECLGSETLEVLSTGSAREGIRLIGTERPDAVILDVRLPDMSGLDAFDRIAKLEPRLPVIMITAYASTETAIETMRRGAFEYLVKPVDFQQLEAAVTKALEVSRLNRVPALLGEDLPESVGDRIVGQSPPMQEVYKAIGRIAPAEAPVLILGESGTGKELVARAIYHYSKRSQKPFLAINCAALPETLLESELFGHEAGAFTGADQRRIGKFEQVHGGTIFLDEIGDMSLPTQAKALRLIQEQKFQRLGGTQTVETNVRIIAATNQDLEKRIAEGSFRLDLFYRLNVFCIRLPALRDRPSDIPELIEHFIRRINHVHNRRISSITHEALQLCLAYHWPGNVRELESAVRFAIIRSAGDVITPDCLPEPLRRAPEKEVKSLPSPAAGMAAFDVRQYVRALLDGNVADIYHKVTREVDRIVLDEVLHSVDGNQVQACKKLGIARMTLRSKLRTLDPQAGESSPVTQDADATGDGPL